MQDVELGVCHGLDETSHGVHGEEVPRRVEHPAKTPFNSKMSVVLQGSIRFRLDHRNHVDHQLHGSLHHNHNHNHNHNLTGQPNLCYTH